MPDRIQSFAPVFDSRARLLILGTMPSVESLRQSFYYSHPRNAFWPIMAEILGTAAPQTAAEKRELLLVNRIALWDVAHTCVREGSLDSAIRDVEANDFETLFAQCPELKAIFFNGATAMKLYQKRVGIMPDGCICRQLPSTSPAYTIPYAQKQEAWRQAIGGFYDTL